MRKINKSLCKGSMVGDQVLRASWLTVDSLSCCHKEQKWGAGSYPKLVLYKVSQAQAGAGIISELSKTHVFSPGSRKSIKLQWLGCLERDPFWLGCFFNSKH